MKTDMSARTIHALNVTGGFAELVRHHRVLQLEPDALNRHLHRPDLLLRHPLENIHEVFFLLDYFVPRDEHRRGVDLCLQQVPLVHVEG
jgi:hypothetical protein